jgi:hypothetical protein
MTRGSPPRRAVVARACVQAYLKAMRSSGLLRLFLLLAVLFAPLSMASTHAAMAMPAPSAGPVVEHGSAEASGHCAQMDQSGEDDPAGAPSSDEADCTIACSCTPPATGHPIGEPLTFAPLVDKPGRSLLMSGLSPQAEPRPPRLS